MRLALKKDRPAGYQRDDEYKSQGNHSMKPMRLVLGAVMVCAFAPAIAGPTTSTFDFKTVKSSTGSGWSKATAGYNATNGTNYGNTLTYAASGGTANNVTVSAWGSTGGSGGFTGTLEKAYIGRYTSGSGANTQYEMGITSQPGTGNTAELSYSTSRGVTTASPNTSNNQHAIDNVGSYEALLYSFESAVTLSSVSIGFPSAGSGLDSDATVLVYTGAGDPTANMSTRTFDQLVAQGGGWQIAGNLFDMKPGTAGTLNTNISSKYWMVGAYMNIGGNKMLGNDTTADYLKVSGVTIVQGLAVPEPDSMALFGIASVALLAARRRKARAA